MIDIREIASTAEREDFIRLPGKVCAADPNWIEPLHVERRRVLSRTHNPFFEHAEAAFFLAFRDGRPVGRISAQVDALAPQADGHRVGMFGMFAADDDPDVAARLFEAVERWLRVRGTGIVRGPFDLSPNQESGLLVDGFDSPPFLMMPHHPRWAGALVEAQGYRKARDLLAYRMDVADGLPDRPRRLADAALDGIAVRSLDRSRYDMDIRTVASIFNDAWSSNWGFIPLTEAEIARMAKELRFVLDPHLVKIAERDGEPLGFIVLLPNVNEAIADLGGRLLPFHWLKLLWRLKTNRIRSARVPLMGVRRDVAGSVAGRLLPFRLIYALEQRALQRGFEQIELGWLLEDNLTVRRLVEALDGQCVKTYRIYEKTLT